MSFLFVENTNIYCSHIHRPGSETSGRGFAITEALTIANTLTEK